MEILEVKHSNYPNHTEFLSSTPTKKKSRERPVIQLNTHCFTTSLSRLSSEHLKNTSPNQHLEPWPLKQNINRPKVLGAMATVLDAVIFPASGLLSAKWFPFSGLRRQLRSRLRLQRLRQPFLSSKKSWAQRPSSWALFKTPSIACHSMPFENLLMSWLLVKPPYKAGC